MDRLNHYRQVVKDVLREYANLFNQQPEGVDVVAVCDEDVDTYTLINVGWDGKERTSLMSVLMRIINGKVWIEEEKTMYGFVDELLNAGIPKEDIVLGNIPAKYRPHTGFAVG